MQKNFPCYNNQHLLCRKKPNLKSSSLTSKKTLNVIILLFSNQNRKSVCQLLKKWYDNSAVDQDPLLQINYTCFIWVWALRISKQLSSICRKTPWLWSCYPFQSPIEKRHWQISYKVWARKNVFLRTGSLNPYQRKGRNKHYPRIFAENSRWARIPSTSKKNSRAIKLLEVVKILRTDKVIHRG